MENNSNQTEKINLNENPNENENKIEEINDLDELSDQIEIIQHENSLSDDENDLSTLRTKNKEELEKEKEIEKEIEKENSVENSVENSIENSDDSSDDYNPDIEKDTEIKSQDEKDKENSIEEENLDGDNDNFDINLKKLQRKDKKKRSTKKKRRKSTKKSEDSNTKRKKGKRKKGKKGKSGKKRTNSKKRRNSENNDRIQLGSEEEEKTPKQKKNRSRTKRTEEEIESHMREILIQMEEANEKDIELNRISKPAITKLQLIPQVSPHLNNHENHNALISCGIFEVIKKWLLPLPDLSKPNKLIQKFCLEIISKFSISTEILKETGIGKIIREISLSSDPSSPVGRISRELLDKWIRQALDLQSDYKKMWENQAKENYLNAPTLLESNVDSDNENENENDNVNDNDNSVFRSNKNVRSNRKNKIKTQNLDQILNRKNKNQSISQNVELPQVPLHDFIRLPKSLISDEEILRRPITNTFEKKIRPPRRK